jgi:hypothetical protein
VLSAAGVEHGFGTRGSEAAAPADVSFARQVHGARALGVPPDPRGAEADALYSSLPGTALGVRTADCVPLLVADPSGSAVLAIHAGWRGSAARISESAVGEFSRALSLDPARLVCAIGPHIGPCCYEVDLPVRRAIRQDEAFVPSRREGHFLLDLFRVNREQLLRAGLRAERIERVGGCTACDPARYESYRRDGSGGRMVHWARVLRLTRPTSGVPSRRPSSAD